MKIIITLLLLSIPAAAGAGGMHGCGHGGGGHMATALYGLFAALGYWVLQHAAKEAAGFVKKTGVALGMALVIIGLIGVLCGVGSHITKGLSRCCSCQEREIMMVGGQEDEMGEMPVMPEKMNAPGPEKKKTR